MGTPSKSGATKKPGPPSSTTQRKQAKKGTGRPRSDESSARRAGAASRSAATHVLTPSNPLSSSSSSSAPMSAPNASFSLKEQEDAVATVRATLPSPSNRDELRKNPIYRVMHTMPRSDVLEVVRSRFAAPHCIRAAAYFDQSYMANPLRRLRLQIGCDGPSGMHLFFARIAAHRHTLRVLDLSRNRLSAEDVVLLCNVLGLGAEGAVAAASIAPRAVAETGASEGPAQPSPTHSSLEMVDLSYNTKIGNAGALHVLRALKRCSTIRALLLRSVGLDDDGALEVSATLRQWPAPAPAGREEEATLNALRPQTASTTKFFVNVNENFIGARGTYILGKGLPDHVSLTLVKQRLPLTKEKSGGQ